jgi:hypothetical protein
VMQLTSLAVAQDPDLWTCPVNPHLMYIWCNIYLFITIGIVQLSCK